LDRKWITFAVLLALLVAGSALVAVSSGGDDAGSGTITVEQAPTSDGGVELLVTVSDELNVPDTVDGAATVELVCVNDAGASVIQARHSWPLERDGDPPAPHVHQPASPQELQTIDECELRGTDPPLSGKLGLARYRAGVVS